MNTLQIIVDGIVLDLPDEPQASITFETNNIGNLSDRNGDFGKTFDLPMSGRNRQAFGMTDLVESATDPNLTKPCQIFVDNWIVFAGSIRVARYFGNLMQVQLIGQLGTLLEQVKEMTLADFQYFQFPQVNCNQADYQALMTAPDNGVVVAKADGGWTPSRALQNNREPKFYPVQLPLWYDLRMVISQIVDELGYTLAGDILTDPLLDDVYLQQGYFGHDRNSMQYEGLTAVAEYSFPFFRLPGSGTADAGVINLTTSDLTWFDVTFNNVNTSVITNGRYKVKVSWDYATRTGTGSFAITWNVGVMIAGANVSTNYEYVALAQTELTITDAMTTGVVPAEFELEFDYANTVGGQVVFGADYKSHTGTLQDVDLYGLKIEFTYQYLDEPCHFQVMRASDTLPRISVSDLFIEVCQRFGYQVTADAQTNEVRFDKLDKLFIRSRAIDWNGKVYSELNSMFGPQYETSFEYGEYAAKNYWENKDGSKRGYLTANVANKRSELTAYTSIADEASIVDVRTDLFKVLDQTITLTQGIEGNEDFVVPSVGDARANGSIWFNNGVGIKSNNTGTYTLTSPFPSLDFNGFTRTWELQTASEIFSYTNNTVVLGKLTNATGGARIQDDDQNDNNLISAPLAMDELPFDWQSILDNRYSWLQSILTNRRIHKVLVRVRPTDIPIDFTRPIYWNCAYWYLVSLQDWNLINGDTAVAVLAYLPDFPR
mgnify:CR=1 FL=1